MTDQIDPSERAMLEKAREGARRIVADIEKRIAELEANPPTQTLTPEALAEGRQAMRRALDAARRTVASLDAAAATADEAAGHRKGGMDA